MRIGRRVQHEYQTSRQLYGDFEIESVNVVAVRDCLDEMALLIYPTA